MICPQCGKEMQPGFLQTGNIIAFNKTRHKISLNSKHEEDVMIAKNTLMGSDFHAFICKECGLIVFDYKNVISHL
ncbi:PF20097 family protein [Candidatus Stoquefichus sp. SB1]|uniref:PF20097 family protein n=1 Tax=Candidatus Stoquefichus sp. SB1 TaxID=1658109 RepID=UPI00067EDBF0|nr:PF20097 family protein [Candidatus Stoquefichus sp. SB1]